MSEFVAALPMYDWPEVRAETDAVWARLRDLLRSTGIDAPERLARRNGDLPPVPGGIRDAAGTVIAPDPATLPPDGFDLDTLWRHPKLLFAQSCWGPLERGLDRHAHILWQPDYGAYEGGQGEYYSSALVMRKGAAGDDVLGPAIMPDSQSLQLFMRKRFAFNSPDSMSGLIALARDLEAMGCGVEIFDEMIETGSHRNSVVAVAEGRADLAAVDCRTWSMIRRFEPRANDVEVVAWTAKRKGLPLIASKHLPEAIVAVLQSAVTEVYKPAGRTETA